MIEQYASTMDNLLIPFIYFVVISALFEMTILKKVASSSEKGEIFQKKYKMIRHCICVVYAVLYFISLALRYIYK